MHGLTLNRREAVYAFLMAGFCVVLVLTNIIGIKLFRAPFNPEFALTTGILTYPLTFLFTDLVSEVFGKKRADFMVITGFVLSLVMLAVVQLAIAVDPHPYWVPSPELRFYESADEYQTAFKSVFALNGVLVFGSMAAYLCAQLCDNYLFHFWRRLTKGKHMWIRNNGSTIVSQLVDTAVVNSILFYIGFGMEFWTGVTIMATIYVYKIALAILDTPLVYLGVWIIKSILGDAYPQESEGDAIEAV
ncbi:MAG: queuosine precursor transporter [Myxococcota bacterium]|nr:hypothetical protein [Myxococcales bacterium]MEC7751064.1 queuosine precursor transporter [Myxococcota bacterium]HBU48401.1 hypothetical protein [Myxococcales bacterium]